MTGILPLQVQGVDTQNANRKQEQVAQGVGGAAGVTTAAKYTAKRALKAQEGERILQTTLEGVQTTTRTISRNKSVFSRLVINFKNNMTSFSTDITKRLQAFKNIRYIRPILNSPVTKGISTVVGGTLAFFVLVTEFNKAVSTGEVAIQDFKNKIEMVKQ